MNWHVVYRCLDCGRVGRESWRRWFAYDLGIGGEFGCGRCGSGRVAELDVQPCPEYPWTYYAGKKVTT